MREVVYAPGEVYRIVGVQRSAIQVLFGQDEDILHVALGDAAAWEAVPQGGTLFLKPRARSKPTNLIVTTRKLGLERHYAFELRVRSGAIAAQTPETFFQLRFRYPDDERAAALRGIDKGAQALEAKVLQLKLDRGVLEGSRNLAYLVQGPAELTPSEVSDNGRFTVLRFPGAQPLPAVYALGPDGQETLAAFDVRGEFVVVHGVKAQLRLRRGSAVACIWNQAFDARGVGAPSGTAATDVERTTPEGSP